MEKQKNTAQSIFAHLHAEELERQRKQRERSEQQAKTFIAFRKPEGQSVIEYMNSLPEKDEFTQNYLLFMQTLGRPIEAGLTHCKEAVSDYPKNIMGEVLENGCQCHEISLLCTLREPNLRTFFGFVDGYHNNQYASTVSHSFLLSSCDNFLYDMVLQYRMDNYHDMDHLRGWIRNYFGVEIPYEVLLDIYNTKPKNVYANHCRYFKEEIFTSRLKTEAMIKRIQHLTKSP